MKRDRKTVFIIVRVTPEEKVSLLKKAGRNLSKHIRIILGLQ